VQIRRIVVEGQPREIVLETSFLQKRQVCELLHTSYSAHDGGIGRAFNVRRGSQAKVEKLPEKSQAQKGPWYGSCGRMSCQEA
jgi:hypothetical protein